MAKRTRSKGVPNKPASNRSKGYTGPGPTGPATIPHGFSSAMPTGLVAKKGTIIGQPPRGHRSTVLVRSRRRT